MKVIVSTQEFTRLVETRQHFLTVAGGININTTKAAVQQTLQSQPPAWATVGYTNDVLFIYTID